MGADPTTTAACAFGDPACPCQDGDVCHYVDDPKSETLAMTPITTAARDAGHTDRLTATMLLTLAVLAVTLNFIWVLA